MVPKLACNIKRKNIKIYDIYGNSFDYGKKLYLV